jgi:hypothetical protein
MALSISAGYTLAEYAPNLQSRDRYKSTISLKLAFITYIPRYLEILNSGVIESVYWQYMSSLVALVPSAYRTLLVDSFK